MLFNVFSVASLLIWHWQEKKKKRKTVSWGINLKHKATLDSWNSTVGSPENSVGGGNKRKTNEEESWEVKEL